MKSRVFILWILVAAFASSSAGAALANGSNASIAQYGPFRSLDVGGEQQIPRGGPTPESGVAGHNTTPSPTQSVDRGSNPPLPAVDVQPPRQHAATLRKLPFSGFEAIPVLLAGLALLTAGLVLRSRTSRTGD